ncbi:hypothetical protein XAP412_870004 [Xanthomonas phaseoli pv. phaseoli]|uniref:Uncharacterized protein n=1 Tax=Xanthomonas campestris pv. phaseoli TaxID=317013 RepID=A0AB38E5Q5_XANCH|nr:hypothetical protein XAP6984_900004 [Xanthomonas phaseoli pv. phaseoli]SON91146.1 hypothetical protein XAP412_870004 [Xanthomonas phaseoli pv. phaseoli]SON92804.1 hypothetical protein XAP7430_890004 [Xanthomonas phaseoli pv. phaseoli]SOO29769.1 hypothetical protein XAP6164_3600027 [Xanthomonas phaseoli pv. phaseoli]
MSGTITGRGCKRSSSACGFSRNRAWGQQLLRPIAWENAVSGRVSGGGGAVCTSVRVVPDGKDHGTCRDRQWAASARCRVAMIRRAALAAPGRGGYALTLALRLPSPTPPCACAVLQRAT